MNQPARNVTQSTELPSGPDARTPIPLGYLREPAELGPPPLTRWQALAVAGFILSFPALLVLVWWLTAGR